MLRARVRGIYATALTKLLLDHDFKIVHPSVEIRERFNLEENFGSPDLDIWTGLNRQGVKVFGRVEAVDTFRQILRERLVDVVIRGWPRWRWSVGQTSRGLNVEFPGFSKRALDKIRGLVVPTLKDHHYYKACGGEISSMVDMAERLVEGGKPVQEVERLLKQTIEPIYPLELSIVEIEHVKLDGKILRLGKAQIEVFNRWNSMIRLLRVFGKEGVYNGIGTHKEPGDRAVTEARISSWHLKTKYFSNDGRYKGTYINVNTPIEFYPYGVRYVDLEVDVIFLPNGEVQVVDEEKLEKAVEDGIVTEKLWQIAKRKLERILRNP